MVEKIYGMAGAHVRPPAPEHVPAGLGRMRPSQNLGMERQALLGRREGPRDLEAPFLLEDKAHLAWRAEAIRAGRAVGGARSGTR